MTQVQERYGLLAHMRSIKNGEGFEGPCPIHRGTKPDQFRVSVTKNCWNCFADCQRGGNVLDFVALMEGVDVRAAAVQINEWFKLGLAHASLHATLLGLSCHAISCQTTADRFWLSVARQTAL